MAQNLANINISEIAKTHTHKYHTKEVGDMSSRSRVFAGSAELTSRLVGVSQPELYFLKEGEYLGPQIYTRCTARINPQGLIAENKILSGNFGLAAEKHHGKGVLTKSLAVLLGGMKAGIDEETGEFVRPRERVNDNKLEAGRGEWDDITEFKLRKPIYLAGFGRISPFDLRMGMTPLQHMELLSLMLEDAKGGPLDATESYVAQMVMYLIGRDGVNPELSWIGQRGNNISVTDEDEYNRYFNRELRKQYHEQLMRDDTFRKRFDEVMRRSDPDNDDYLKNRNEEFRHIREAGRRVAHLIQLLLNSGTYGQTFGGGNSLFELLTDQYVHFDWTGMPPRAASLLEAILKYWEMVGARKDSGMHLTVPHYVFHDEQGSEMTKSVAHATLRAEENRKARAVHTIHFDMYQNFDDLLKIGEPGSAFRSQGEIMHRGIAAWFIGKQPDDSDLLHALTRRGATDKEAFMTTQFPMGVWGFLVPGSGKPMEIFQHILHPTIANLVDTTSAARKAAERTKVEV